MKKPLEYLIKILDIGKAITTEKDHDKLLEMILTESRNITNADAGTLYIRQGEQLIFKIIQNDTLSIYKGKNGEKIDLPALDINGDSVSAYVARNKQILNIPDIYKASQPYLDGPKKYDQITGYKTESMLVVPLIDQEDEVIGVMLLINAKDQNEKNIPFIKYYEKSVEYYASQVAIYISNRNYLDKINKIFKSFIEVMVTAIDKRSSYNANHTKNMVYLLEKFIIHINNIKHGPLANQYFNKDRANEIIMAAWLHDIGKLVVPLNIMDKSTRLSEKYELVMKKIKIEKLQVKVSMLEGRISNEEYESRTTFLIEAEKIIYECNYPNKYLDDDMLKKLEYIYNYNTVEGDERILIDEEYENITIRRGTLTENERKIMNDHVVYTDEMLSKIPFTEKLKNVRKWASMHHEVLDGSGYPNGVNKDYIPIEVKILTILDIFEALTSSDRPYKKPMELTKALEFLKTMAAQEKLDIVLVEEFIKSKVWER